LQHALHAKPTGGHRNEKGAYRWLFSRYTTVGCIPFASAVFKFVFISQVRFCLKHTDSRGMYIKSLVFSSSCFFVLVNLAIDWHTHGYTGVLVQRTVLTFTDYEWLCLLKMPKLKYDKIYCLHLMAQSQCRRSVGNKFWPGVVVENKESLNNRSNHPNKSGAVTLSEIF